MRFLKCGILSLVVVSLYTACCAQAQSEPSQTEIKSFVSRYVAAFNAQDAARLESLYSSRLQTCLAAEKRDYKDFYDFMLATMWRDPIPAKYTFKVSAVNETNLKALETFGHFAVKPARELHIDYQQGDDLGSIVIYLVRENGRLVADQPCASETTMKQFRDDTPAREEREAHYEWRRASFRVSPRRCSLRERIWKKTLREGGRGASSGARRHRTRNIFVAAQIVLAMVLLVGAVMMVKGLRLVTEPAPNLDAAHALATWVLLPLPSRPSKVINFPRAGTSEMITGWDAG